MLTSVVDRSAIPLGCVDRSAIQRWFVVRGAMFAWFAERPTTFWFAERTTTFGDRHHTASNLDRTRVKSVEARANAGDWNRIMLANLGMGLGWINFADKNYWED